MSYSLNELYRTVGVSKQSVQQAKNRQESFDRELSELIVLANQLKAEHPGCGVEKMYYALRPHFMGRDKFCELFLELGYGVNRVKNYHRTTFSGALYYPNLIEGMCVTRPFQVIQSDITYFQLKGDHYYLVFIIDVYTRLIVGYAVSDHLRTEANIRALKKALGIMNCTPWDTIHHSDRGSQYGSHAYTQLLSGQKIHISMGLVAWENPYAERINGIIKNEYLKRWAIRDFKELKRKVAKAVSHYNEKRLHRAFNMNYTPMEFYQKLIDLPTQERPTVNIYTEGRQNFLGTSSPFEVYPREEPLAHNCPMELNKC
ncbi:IS3 family transposase [Algoriphagus terrigena]|uniref:IS3 family transposase n=1 Tax=Algoriphagus terrigena TaxID=344884 RepID=UPI000416C976|nr:IS3 family transposase [Algoriphagus terrigena]